MIQSSTQSIHQRAIKKPLYTIDNFSDFIIIGQGTYGKVYKARLNLRNSHELEQNLNPSTQQSFQQFGITPNIAVEDIVHYRALKKIKLEKETDGVPITTMREMQVLQHYLGNHPNIVKLEQVLLCNQAQPFLPNQQQLQQQQLQQQQQSMNQHTQPQQPQLGASTMSSPPATGAPKFQSIPKCFYLIFEYCPKDLQMVIKEKNKIFTSQEIVGLTKQLLEGLAFIHQKHVVHRDIKTANILISNDNQVKYCDFGLARSVAEFDPLTQKLNNNQNNSSNQSVFGVTKNQPDKQKAMMTGKLVTRWYRAPEMLLDDQFYSYSVDVWSLGCCIAEILTKGTPLFPGDTEMQTLQLICLRLETNKLSKDHFSAYSNLKKFKEVQSIVHKPFENQSSETRMFLKRSQTKSIDLKGFIREKSPLWQQQNLVDCVGQNNEKEIQSQQQQNEMMEIEQDESQKEGLLDLCTQMLAFDWRKRPSAKELLKHQIFEV